MTRRHLLFATGAAAALSPPVSRAASTVIYSWHFNTGSLGWLPDFTDYGLGIGSLRRIAEIRPLPRELNKPGESGYYLEASNSSDDLFMFLRNRIGPEAGVVPNQWYWPSMHIQFASNAQSGCAGIGGAPGESVFLKAGVMTLEPVAHSINQVMVLAADKGVQGTGGKDLELLGNIANGEPCQPEARRYVMLVRTLFQKNPVRADAYGNLWVAVGTDSGFEGITGLYYYTIGVVLLPFAGPAASLVNK
jgi:hypothetical protein